MQRFIAIRALQSLLAILVMSLIVFGLARLSGNPLDVMLPIEAEQADYAGSRNIGASTGRSPSSTSSSSPRPCRAILGNRSSTRAGPQWLS